MTFFSFVFWGCAVARAGRGVGRLGAWVPGPQDAGRRGDCRGAPFGLRLGRGGFEAADPKSSRVQTAKWGPDVGLGAGQAGAPRLLRAECGCGMGVRGRPARGSGTSRSVSACLFSLISPGKRAHVPQNPARRVTPARHPWAWQTPAHAPERESEGTSAAPLPSAVCSQPPQPPVALWQGPQETGTEGGGGSGWAWPGAGDWAVVN